MKTASTHWFLWLAIAVGLLLIMSAIFSRNGPGTGPLLSIDTSVSRTEIIDARKTLGETITHGEEALLNVLGLQMGIVAFAATMIFGRDFSVQKPRELFGILSFW